jgi:hypothetical protein
MKASTELGLLLFLFLLPLNILLVFRENNSLEIDAIIITDNNIKSQ